MNIFRYSIYRIVGLSVCLAAITLFSGAARAQMKMHVVNVGQGEAVLLEFPRHAILVDAGGEDTFETAAQNRFRRHLLAYLDAFFVRRADLNRTLHSVVVSHAHEDHVKNLRAVFDRFTILNFVEGGGNAGASGMKEVREIRARLAANDIKHHRIYARNVKRPSFMREWRNDLSESSQTDIRFLSAGRDCIDDNNASLVMRVEYAGKSFLLTGDAETEDKEGRNLGCGGLIFRLLDERAAFPELLDVDVLKVAHHGSRFSTAEIFLQKVAPDFAVLSAGKTTTRSAGGGAPFHAYFFGHPNESVVQQLENATARSRAPVNVTTMTKGRTIFSENRRIEKAIYCTGWDGDVVFSVERDGGAISVETIPD